MNDGVVTLIRSNIQKAYNDASAGMHLMLDVLLHLDLYILSQISWVTVLHWK